MSERFSRQSFLGEDSEELMATVRVGIVGLGGGGSHIAQQLAHVGILNFELFDYDLFEESNINRTVGGHNADIENATPKVEIAHRFIKAVRPNAKVSVHQDKWQHRAEKLHRCDIVFGCLDGFASRRDLEAECRRLLIPLIDIGMDITLGDGQIPYMAGQVILSMPGSHCMHCMNFLTREKLAEESKMYGGAGSRPQVVWPNGVLASTAVGLFVELVTDWTRGLKESIYLEYLGNDHLVRRHPVLRYLKDISCEHYKLENAGPAEIKRL